MSKHIIAGLDIGTNVIRVVVGEFTDEKLQLIARSSSQSQGIRNGFIVNKAESLTAIKKAIRLTEKQIGQSIEEIWVTAGGEPLSVKLSSASCAVTHGSGMVSETDIDNTIVRAARKSLSTNQRNIESIILRYRLDGQETISDPTGMSGKKLELDTMMFNYAAQNADALEDILDQIDVQIGDFFPGIIGASIVTLSTVDRKVGCVLVDIGADTTSFVVYDQDSPVYVGTVDYGSDAITQALALEYQISVSDAEIAKRNGPLPNGLNRDLVNKTVAAKLSQLFKDINKQLGDIDRKGNLPGGIILCGGGALVDDIEKIARTICKVPARKAVVRAYKQKDTDDRELAWASVYGLVIHAIEEERFRRKGALYKIARTVWNNAKKYFV